MCCSTCRPGAVSVGRHAMMSTWVAFPAQATYLARGVAEYVAGPLERANNLLRHQECSRSMGAHVYGSACMGLTLTPLIPIRLGAAPLLMQSHLPA